MFYNLEKEIKAIIADISGFDEDKITLETNLIKKLEVDSIKAIEIAVALEKKYKISIRDEDISNIIIVKDSIDLTNKF